MLEAVASAIGASADEIKFIFLLLLSLPLSLLIPFLPPGPTHVYIISVTVYYVYFIMSLGSGLLELLGMTFTTYVLCRLGKSGQLANLPIRWPWLNFLILMTWLTVNNLKTYILGTNLAVIDISGSMMIIVMKLTSFAWDIYDGTRPLSELDKVQALNRITSIPTILEYTSFSLFFPGILVGPSFKYASYVAFLNRSSFATAPAVDKSEIPPSSLQAHTMLPPGRHRQMIKKLLVGLVMLGTFAAYGGTFHFSRIAEPDIRDSSLLYKVVFTQMSAFIARTKYYAVWSISEAAFVGSGLAYDPITGKYDGSRNVDILNIEFAENVKVLLDHWNMNTNQWLREAIYKRLALPGKKPGFKCTMATFSTSALWHGVSISYYLSFLFAGFLVPLARTIRSILRPWFIRVAGLEDEFKKPIASDTTGPSMKDKKATGVNKHRWIKLFYDIVGTLCTQAVINYATIPFILLNFWQAIEIWSLLYWYGHVMVFVPSIIFWFGGDRALAKVLGTSKPFQHRATSKSLEAVAATATSLKVPPTLSSSLSSDSNDSDISRNSSSAHLVAQGMPNAPLEEIAKEIKQQADNHFSLQKDE